VVEYSGVQFPGKASGFFLARKSPVSHIAKYDDDNRMRFSFAGVAARRALVASTIADLVRIGETTFHDLGGRLGRQRSFIGNIWHPGLCGHSWMHHRTLDVLRQHEQKHQGFVLVGDYFRGNSLDACVMAAKENVDRYLDRWDTRRRAAVSPLA
jgi:oxygen-dependent protoporphyrinogen oxidase